MTQAELNIIIRVQAQQARAQINAMQKQLAMLNAEGARAGGIGSGATAGAISATRAISGTTVAVNTYTASASRAALATEKMTTTAALQRMRSMGSQAQWTGRQLATNFTAPIAVAIGFATKWELANESSAIQVQKVYGDVIRSAGDVGQSAETLAKEVGGTYTVMENGSAVTKTIANNNSALGKTFELLSEKYAVQKKDVTDIAADWASAGSSGIALAKSTELTLKTMVIGGLDAAAASQGLIAIQAQYGLSTDDLVKSVSDLNAVENITGIKLEGLIEGFYRAAGSARVAGVDSEHLAAMLSSLVPAAGSAASAGQGLKTIFTRILAPGKEASEIMAMLNINTAEAGWTSLNAAQRMELLAKKFEGLTQQQKVQADASIFSTYQINRASVAFHDIALALDPSTRASSNYGKSLDQLSDQTTVATIAQQELQTVLESNPQKVKQVGIIIQNALTNAIIPLVPWIVYLGQSLADLFKRFQNLNPAIQKFIIITAVIIAAIGPFLVILFSFKILIAQLGLGFIKLSKIVTGPFALAMRLMRLLTGQSIVAAQAQMTVEEAKTAALRTEVQRREALEASSYTKRKQMFQVHASISIAALSAFISETITLIREGNDVFLRDTYGSLAQAQGFWTEYIGGVTTATGTVSSAVVAHATTVATAIGGWTGTSGAEVALFATTSTTAIATWASVTAGEVVVWTTGTAALFDTWAAYVLGVILAWLAAMQAALGTGLGVLTTEIVLWIGTSDAIIAAGMTAWTGTVYAGFIGMAGAAALGAGFIEGEIISMQFIGTTAITAGETAKVGAVVAGQAAQATAIGAGGIIIVGEIIASETAGMLAITAGETAKVGIIASAQAAMVAAMTAGGAAMVTVATGTVTLLGAIFAGIFAVFTSPITLAIIAVLAVIVIFRDKIKQGIDNVRAYFADLPPDIRNNLQPLVNLFDNVGSFIRKVFNALPEGVQGGLIGVVRLVQTAAMKVYELFSYLNPFAHHSPSLVENVTRGMAVVGQQFGLAARNIEGHVKQAYGAMKNFGSAVAGFMDGQDSVKRAQDRADVATVAPGALAAWDGLSGAVQVLTNDLDATSSAMGNQQAVLDSLDATISSADTNLGNMKNTLDELKTAAQSTSDQISAANAAITNFANAPLNGMKAMDDAIFSNLMSQKQLQLQMLDMANQPGYEDAATKVAALAGEIEKLRATQADLRNAGAGSDITGQYDSMIAGLEAQMGGIVAGGNSGPMDALQKQLNELKTQAERLDLQKSLQFDPLTRQVNELANGMKELPFDQVVSGITASQAQVIALTAVYDQQSAAVRNQQAVVDAAQASRDALGQTYDSEKIKLEALKQVYDGINTSLTDANRLLSDMASGSSAAISAAKAAADSSSKLSPGAQNFQDASSGTFDQPGGSGSISREALPGQNVNADQSAAIEKMNQDLANQLGKTFQGVDMFGPIKVAWNGFVGWWNESVIPSWQGLTGMFSGAANAFADPFTSMNDSGSAVRGTLKNLGDTWDTVWARLQPPLQELGDRLMPHLRDAAGKLQDGFQQLWDKTRPALESLKDSWDAIWPAVKVAGAIIGLVIVTTIATIALLATIVVEIFSNVIGPIFDWLARVISGAINVISGVIRALGGVFEFVFGFILILIGSFRAAFTGNTDMLEQGIKMMLSGLVDFVAGIGRIIEGLFSIVWNTIKDFVLVVWGIIAGFITGVIDFFKFLYDVLVGHSIIPDLVNAIVGFFQWLWDTAVAIVKGLVEGVIGFFANLATTVVDGVIAFVNDVSSRYVAFKDGLISVAQTIASWVSQKFTDLRNAVVGTISEFISTIQTKWASFSSIIQSAADVLKNGAVESFRLLGVGLQWVYDNVIAPAFNAVTTAVNAVKSGFDTAVQGIRNVWGTLVDILREPVKFMVNTVYNDGVKPAWNAIASRIGLGSLPDIGRMATGGGVHGPGGPKDDLIPAMLSNGEHVIPANEVAMAGGQTGIYQMREMIRSGAMQFFADGGAVYEQMFNSVRSKFPQANLNSGYRAGANDMHGQGKAVDLGQVGRSGGLGHPYLADMNRWIHDTYGAATYELIYDGFGDDRPDLKNGRPLNYGDATASQHRNHVHWAMQSAEALGGGGSAGGGQSALGKAVGWLRGEVAKGYDAIMNKVSSIIPRSDIPMKNIPGAFFDTVNGKIHNFISGESDKTEAAMTSLTNAQSPGVEKWRPIVMAALSRVGQNSNLADITLRRMDQESSGNWRAINNYDSNAAQGTPSKGLMQVIDPTFQAYRDRELSSDIYEPMANIVASMNYTLRRYGSLGAGYNQAGGYDNGGWLKPGQTGMNFSRTPEPVFSSSQWSTLEGNLRMNQSILDTVASVAMVATKSMASAPMIPTAAPRATVTSVPVEKQVTNSVTVNIGTVNVNGITSGDDAGKLIDNLRSMAGS